ncbi:MAG TPA: hypothetical protein VFV38_16650 [Ktedonobacteraceae bacterium]|nr:hypothetical protein [Ktedonobacteraceae bacterium]
MGDYYNSTRRQRRHHYLYRNSLNGLAGGIFILALFFGFLLGGSFGKAGFLVLLFAGLALASLFGSLSSMNRRGIYGGFHGFIWFLGLALCFWIGFWPWILLPIAVSAILGSLFNPIVNSMVGFGSVSQGPQQFPQQQPYPQEYPPQEQPDYERGYQGSQQRSSSASQEPKQQHEQPLVSYPEQELPPMQQ